jgi:hypothetical protein
MYQRISVLCVLILAPLGRGQTIDFEDLPLPPGPNKFFDGSSAVVPPATTSDTLFTSRGATFVNHYDTSFGGFWNGWSYSNVVNKVDPGPGNQYAAYAPAGGDNSATYGVAYVDGFDPTTIKLPANTKPQSMRITNTTYTALIMLTGDPNHIARKFDAAHQDFLKLTIEGLVGNTVVSSIDVMLADYRFPTDAEHKLIDDWSTVDLTPLGNVTSLEFAMESSDTSTFGTQTFPNTPTYFAMDNLVVAPVPEPGTLALVGVATLGWAVRRHRRNAPAVATST